MSVELLVLVDDKIKEADYFLEKIKSSQFNEEMTFLISAFLAATRSIPDYLLEDYNLKFGLNIPLDDFLSYHTFEEEAKKQHKRVAILFIDDFKKEFSKLKNDPIAGGMLKKRNIKVHRRKVDNLLHAELKTEEILQLSEKSSAVLYDLKGNVIQRSDSNTKQEDIGLDSKLEESKKATSIKWYFAEYPTKEAPLICQEFLDLIKNFKNSIVVRYP